MPVKPEGESLKVSVAQSYQLFANPWTIAFQTPLSMEFSRQEYWSGLPIPSPGDLPDPGIKPTSPALAGRFFTIWARREAPCEAWYYLKKKKKKVLIAFLFRISINSAKGILKIKMDYHRLSDLKFYLKFLLSLPSVLASFWLISYLKSMRCWKD